MAANQIIWADPTGSGTTPGVVQYTDIDGVTQTYDAVNFIYSSPTNPALTGTMCPYQLTMFGGFRVGYSDTTNVGGNSVINKAAGRIKMAAATTSITVTSSYCFASSVVAVNLETADATATRFIVVPAAGSFTVTFNAASTGAVNLSFTITNVF